MLSSVAETFSKRLQIVLSAPLYSIDNISSPGLTSALLTEDLKDSEAADP